MAIPKNGLRDIRTHAGKIDRISNPHLAYMQITCIEMEKFRKSRERASAVHRLERLDSRIQAIDREKAALLAALAERSRAAQPRAAHPEERPIPSKNARGFRLRY